MPMYPENSPFYVNSGNVPDARGTAVRTGGLDPAGGQAGAPPIPGSAAFNEIQRGADCGNLGGHNVAELGA